MTAGTAHTALGGASPGHGGRGPLKASNGPPHAGRGKGAERVRVCVGGWVVTCQGRREGGRGQPTAARGRDMGGGSWAVGRNPTTQGVVKKKSIHQKEKKLAVPKWRNEEYG